MAPAPRQGGGPVFPSKVWFPLLVICAIAIFREGPGLLVLVGMVMAARALWDGKIEQIRTSAIVRDKSPVGFWTMLLLYGCVGGFMLRRGLRTRS